MFLPEARVNNKDLHVTLICSLNLSLSLTSSCLPLSPWPTTHDIIALYLLTSPSLSKQGFDDLAYDPACLYRTNRAAEDVSNADDARIE